MYYQYFIYILQCSDGSYYTGITSNLSKRFEQHQAGTNRNSYTYSRRPVKMKFYQEFNDVLQAIYFEKKIKGWSRAKKKAIIDDNWDLLPLLAECKNETHYKNYKKD